MKHCTERRAGQCPDTVNVTVGVNSVLRYRADVTDDGAVYGLLVRDVNDTDVPGGKYAGRVESVGRAHISFARAQYTSIIFVSLLVLV